MRGFFFFGESHWIRCHLETLLYFYLFRGSCLLSVNTVPQKTFPLSAELRRLEQLSSVWVQIKRWLLLSLPRDQDGGTSNILLAGWRERASVLPPLQKSSSSDSLLRQYSCQAASVLSEVSSRNGLWKMILLFWSCWQLEEQRGGGRAEHPSHAIPSLWAQGFCWQAVVEWPMGVGRSQEVLISLSSFCLSGRHPSHF